MANADRAARRLYEILLFAMCKGWPLPGTAMANPRRTGYRSVAHRALVDKTKIYLTPLHVNLGLTNVFVKAMNKEGEEFG